MILLLITAGKDAALIHQLTARMMDLKILCVTWRAKIRAIPCAHDIGESWGPGDDILADVAVSEVTRNWDTGPPVPDLPDVTDSDVSDVIDENSDDFFDGHDGEDSNGSEDSFSVPLVGSFSMHSPKHARVL
jgi:hypothetical protein